MNLAHHAHTLKDGHHGHAPQVHRLIERVLVLAEPLDELSPIGRDARRERERIACEPAVERRDRLFIGAQEFSIALLRDNP